MTDKIKQKWKEARVSIRVLSILAAMSCLLFVVVVMATDTDSDGMSDAYETHFQLNPTNAADAALNYDSDTLTNLAEYAASTDPYESDTDRDGWYDGVDNVPLSRLFIDWGELLYTDGDIYEYTGPAWWVSAFKLDGEWSTNPPAWHVASSVTSGVGSLSIDIDRDLQTTDLVLAIELYDHTNATLYIDLYDTNSTIVATNLFGNILAGTDAAVSLKYDIPLETYPTAAGILIRRGSGEVTVYESLIYVDKDGDGLDADQEAQLGSSDSSTDTDSDTLSDYAEVFTHGSDPTLVDSDGDGYDDDVEVSNGTDPADASSRVHSSYQYSMRIHLRDLGISNELSDVPMLLVLDSTKIDYSQFKSDGDDIAFADPDGNVLKHEKVKWDSTGKSYVWVKASSLFGASSHDYIMMHWGNPGANDTSDSGSVWSEGYVGVWHMEESSDAISIADSTSYDNSGTNNGTTATNGPVGGARDFYYDYIDCGQASNLILSNGITMSAWINRNSSYPQKGQGHVLNMGGNWPDDGYSLFNYYKNIRAELRGGGGEKKVNNELNDDDVWHHVAATWDTSDHTIRTYIDGELQGITATFNQLIGSSGQNFNIGRNANQGTFAYFMGKIDEPRLANKAHSSDWIKYQYKTMTDDAVVYGSQEAGIKTPQTASEPSATGGFTVYRTDVNANFDLVVNYSVTGGTAVEGVDYQTLSGTATIPAGSLQATVLITVIDDYAIETNETINIELEKGNYRAISGNASLTVTLSDDDVDNDSDGMVDHWESHHFGSTTNDGAGDADSDDLSDLLEFQNGTDPNDTDSDNDGMPDGWEVTNSFDPLTDDSAGDADSDALSNLGEYQNSTDPNDSDSDDDGMPDGWEVDASLNPLSDDSTGDADSDGLNNLAEYTNGTDPNDTDSDDDGLTDGAEINTHSTDPTDSDSDDDGVPDGAEVNDYSTDPNSVDVDTDGDGLTNDDEYNLCGTSPILVDSDSDGTNDYYVNFSIVPTNTSKRSGSWTDVGTELHALSNKFARVEYDVSIPDAGMYMLAVNVTNTASATATKNFNVQLLIDGVPLDWDTIAVPAYSNAIGEWMVPWLTATNHTIRLAWPDQNDTDMLLGIKEIQVKSIDGPDANTNGVLDWMETAIAEGGNTDEDYLSDHYEFNTSHTDIVCFDTDGDMLSDGDEINLYGTDPLLADSDNDGINDTTLLIERNGIDADRREVAAPDQPWTTNGTALVNLCNAKAFYNMTITNEGMYIVELQASNYETEPMDDYRFELYLYVNGSKVWWPVFEIFADKDVSGTDYVYTPWLPEGTHEIGVSWENDGVSGTRDANISIEKIRLYKTDGADANTNGVQDWVEERLAVNMTKDTDNDGLVDYDEVVIYGTSPVLVDTDGDGMPDGWEVDNGFDPTDDSDASLDADADGLTNLGEYQNGTDPNDTDSDDDGLTDGVEVNTHGTDPNDIDSDDDGLTDGVEVNTHGTDPNDTDSDDDGMPDGWEVTNGLDPLTDDSEGDADSDGLSNLGEYQNSTDPNDSDSDDDGMSDGWEVNGGLNPLSDDSAADADSDGLSNLVEYQNGTDPSDTDSDDDGLTDAAEINTYGTDPTDSDSDDDGVSDWEELEESLTDPWTAEFDGTVTDIDIVNGSETNSAKGNWVVEDTEIVAKRSRGAVEYTLTASTNDMHRILIEASHDWLMSTCTPVEPVDSSDLMIYIDGRYLGKKTLTAADGGYSDVRVFTPWIGPGDHTVKVFWENTHSRISLRIKQIKLQQLGGSDTDSDGVKDWVEVSVANITSLDGGTTNASGQRVSYVSPSCIEGDARYVDMMSISSATTDPLAQHGAGDRWYADIDLLSSGTTDFDVAFMSNAVTISSSVIWESLNVLEAEDLVIRKDDALKLAALSAGETNGTVGIDITEDTTAITNVTMNIGDALVYVFDAAGEYTVTGTFSNQNGIVTDSMTVSVLEGSFPTNTPACMIGKTREWACTNMPLSAVLESDDTVQLVRDGTDVSIDMSKVNKDHYMVARIGENGPILASSKLNGFWVQAAVDSYMWIVESYEDGSDLVENTAIVKNLPDDVDVELKVIVSGVTFEDLSTQRWITLPDVDEIGEYAFRMCRSAEVSTSACHTIKLYQNGEYIGEAYYSGVLFPDE